jgi:hypothetical protein
MSAAQGTEAWLMERLGMPTASCFGDVMAKIKTGEAAARRNYRAQLVVERLTQKPMAFFMSQPMRDGVEREPFARIEYEVRKGVLVQEVGLIRHDSLACGASPDGLVESDGGVEIKCPTEATHFDYLSLAAGKCPSDYYWQIHGGMWITGRTWWDFVSFHPAYPEGLRLIVRRIKRDEEACAKLDAEMKLFIGEVDAAEKFAREYVEPESQS